MGHASLPYNDQEQENQEKERDQPNLEEHFQECQHLLGRLLDGG